MTLSFLSEVLPGELYFGGMPTAQQLSLLEKDNIRWIINVMSEEEKQRYPYPKSFVEKSMKLWEYPIFDQNIPCQPLSFLEWIYNIVHYWSSFPQRPKIYIHCRGGHGRSALATGCFLFFYHQLQTYGIYNKLHLKSMTMMDIIHVITKAHQRRQELNPKYFDRLCPVARCQRIFLHELPIYVKQLKSPISLK